MTQVLWEPGGENAALEPFDTRRFEYLITHGRNRKEAINAHFDLIGDGWKNLDYIRLPSHTVLALWRRLRPA